MLYRKLQWDNSKKYLNFVDESCSHEFYHLNKINNLSTILSIARCSFAFNDSFDVRIMLAIGKK